MMLHRATLLVAALAFAGVACEAGPDDPAADTSPGADTTLAGDTDASDEPDSALEDVLADVPPTPATQMEWPVGSPTVPRLTSTQYANAVRDLFGADIVVPRNIEPDLEQAGLLQIGAAAATVSPRGVERFEAAAYAISEQVIDDDFIDAFPCEPSASRDDDCAGEWLSAVGSRAWRRPLTADETTTLVEVSGHAAEVLDDFFAGLEFGAAAILQSPNFLFRVELGSAPVDDGEPRRYDAWELASRLSFLLWNTIPDEALREAAAGGELDTDEGLLAQVDRMLDDERAREGVRTFFDELYGLHELDRLTKDPEVFPSFSADLGEAAREETLLGIEHLVFELDGDMRELVTTRRTFLDRRLAALYDVRAPAPEGFAETELPADELRQGLLGQAAILALRAHATSTSATLRGKFIREALLCGEIPAPPSGVDTSIPEPDENARTLRERVAAHLEEDFCAGCHVLMDPLGLALEHFDGIGAYRELENGVEVDTSGSLDGLDFVEYGEFVELLAADPRVTSCMVQKLNRYANSTVETPDQREALEPLHDLFAYDGYRFRSLLRDYVSSPAFRTVGEIE